jgi:hypothetical protein
METKPFLYIFSYLRLNIFLRQRRRLDSHLKAAIRIQRRLHETPGFPQNCWNL